MAKTRSYEEYFELYAERHDLCRHKEELRKMAPSGITELETKDKKLTELDKEIEKLDAKLRPDSDSEPAPDRRENQIHGVIARAYESVLSALAREPTNNEVWGVLMNTTYDRDEVIQEVTADCIHWISWRGEEQKMKRATFNNFMAKLRNSRIDSSNHG